MDRTVTKTLRPVSELFPGVKLSPAMKKLKVWTFDRTDADPGRIFVPEVDPHFVFDAAVLEAVILGIVLNRPVYLWGETGCGKTAILKQVASRLGMAAVRQNFDDAVGRSELVGSPVASVQDGHGVIKWRRGSLATALLLVGGYYIADEYDLGTPSATSCLNAILETESVDPVRMYVPETEEILVANRHFRVAATGNTDGVNPDERGIYAGTQSQNMATLNRFAFRVNVPYCPPEVERDVLRSKFEGFPDDVLDRLVSFVKEYRNAFSKTKELSVPLSTRVVHAIAEATIFNGSLLSSLNLCLLNSVPSAERVVVTRLAKNVGILS